MVKIPANQGPKGIRTQSSKDLNRTPRIQIDKNKTSSKQLSRGRDAGMSIRMGSIPNKNPKKA